MFFQPKIEVLLINPVETTKYLPYFSKDFKLICIEALDFFAESLINDPDNKIRTSCVNKSEIAALNLISDPEEEIRIKCAEKWESCAKYLCIDDSWRVRKACLEWESCYSLMLFNENEDDTDILQTLALAFYDSKDESEKSKAKEILRHLLEEDEDFALDCLEILDNDLKLYCACNHRSIALKLIHEEDTEIIEASIVRLIEDNDWYEFTDEELAELCRLDENLALLILDDHPDSWEVNKACLDTWEVCAFQLLLSWHDEISEYAQSIALKSTNSSLKLEAIKNLEQGYLNATIFIHDENKDIRIACVKSDEDFAFQLLDDPEVKVRIACTEYFDCAVKLINDEDYLVRQACANNYYECALKLIDDVHENVKATALNTINENKNLPLPFGE